MANPKEIRILEAVFEQVCKVIEADSFYAALYDRVSVKLDFPVVATKSNGALKRLPVGGTSISSHPYRPSDRLPDFLLANTRPLLIPDNFAAWAEENHLQYEPVVDTLPRAWLGVPLVARGRAIGGVVVESTRDNAFDERAVRILSAMANQASAALANARLIESLRIVNQVGQTLTSEVSLSVEGILTLIHEQLSRLMNTNDMYVALYDLGTQMLSFPFAMYNGEREYDWKSREFDLASDIIPGLTEEVLQTRKHLNPKDVAGWYVNRGIEPKVKPVPKSWAGVPLMKGELPLGVIALQNDEVAGLYGADDIEILESMARQAAVALANTRLVERLNVVNEVGQTLAAGIELSLDEILERVYDQVSRVMDTRNMYIAMYDQDTKELSFPFAMYNGQRELDWPSRKVEGIQGLTEAVLLDSELKPLNPPDVAQWYREKGIEPKVEPVPKSWIGVPLVSGDKIIGIISLQNDEVAYLYKEDDIEVLKTLAGQTAIAIENARLLQNLEERTQQLADLNATLESRVEERTQQLAGLQDIGIQLTSQLNLDEVLGAIAENAFALVNADCCTLFVYNAQEERFEFGIRKGMFTENPTLPSQTSFANRIVKIQKAIFCEEEADYPEVKPTYIEDKKIESFAAIPLVIHNKTAGLVYVNFFESHTFSPEEREILQLLSTQAAVAIENAQLFNSLEQERKKTIAVGRLTTVSAMATAIVHKMNNLAGTIPVRVELIKELLAPGVPDYDQIMKYLANISNEGEELLGAAAAIASAASEAKELELADIDLLISAAIKKIEAPSSIKIHNYCASGLPKVLTFSGEMVDIFENLIRNAIEAIEGAGSVTIKSRVFVENAQNWVAIDIVDTGHGIPPEIQDRIFELFFSTKPGSMGFALWRAKTLIESLSGRIDLVTEVGQGTTFSVVLPAS